LTRSGTTTFNTLQHAQIFLLKEKQQAAHALSRSFFEVIFMKRYLGLLLIAVLAVSVLSAAGVVTTKQVAAADPAPYVINVNAPIGKTYSWKSHEMNFHYNMIDPLKLIVSKSKGSTASVTLNTQPGQITRGQAGVGVALQPNVGLDTRAWAGAKDRQVIVKVTTKTDITIKGDKLVAAEAGVGTFGTVSHQGSKHEFVLIYRDTGSDTQNVVDKQTVSITQTKTIDTSHYSSTTGSPLTLENVYTGICAMVLVETSVNAPMVSEYASARVTVERIELTFVT
jgi:hypothetical protein